MAISSAGLGSGLDVEGIVSKLMAIERQPLAALTKRETSYQTKLTSYGTLSSAVSAFQKAAAALNAANTISQVGVTSSDSAVVSASGTKTSAVGSYSVEISQLAARQQLVTAGQASLTAALGTGTLNFEFGKISGGTFDSATGKYTGATFTGSGAGTKSVTITAANNSLTGIRDAVNAANIGVTASIINDGSGTPYRLSFTSTSGAGNSLKITELTNPGVGLDTIFTNDPAGTQHLSETVTGKDALLKVNGLSVSQSSNTVTGVISGVTLTLNKTNAGSPATVTVNKDSASLVTAVQDFVKKYNELNDAIKQLTAFDPKNPSKNGLLLGDPVVRSVQTQIRSTMANLVPGLKGAYTNLSQIGLSFQKDGSLTLDSDKLKTALAANGSDVAALFSSFGRPTDSLISYTGSTSSTVAGSRAVNITAIATQGNVTGSAAASLTVAAGATLNVTVDGVSASVTIPAGTYTQAALNTAVQSAINGNSSLSDAGISVAVTDVAGKLTVTSNRYGSASNVAITGGSAAVGLFGSASLAGTSGVDVAGTVDGIVANGSGQSLTSQDGLKFLVSGGATGNRGTIEFARGYGSLLDTLTSGYLGSGGIFASKKDGVNKSIADINKQRDQINTRLISTEKRLRAQFTSLDKIVSKLSAISNFLNQQLGALNKSLNGK